MNPRAEDPVDVAALRVVREDSTRIAPRTNLPFLSYERDSVPMDPSLLDVSAGFNNPLHRKQVRITGSQSGWLSAAGEMLTTAFKRNQGEEHKFVRLRAKSTLMRLIVDFFIANAPADCFDSVMSEQDFRRNLGLPPLPELEMYEYLQVPEEERVLADGFNPDNQAVFDSWVTRFTNCTYDKGRSYDSLMTSDFKNGFNAGMVRAQFFITDTQHALIGRMEQHLGRQVDLNRSRNKVEAGVTRKPSASALSRAMIDYFYFRAAGDELAQASGEQDARARLGIHPLPELEQFIENCKAAL